MDAIKASRHKKMDKFGTRGTTDIVSLIPAEVAGLTEIKRDAARRGDGYAPLPARGVVLATAQTASLRDRPLGIRKDFSYRNLISERRLRP
jgi:hypothetical protein